MAVLSILWLALSPLLANTTGVLDPSAALRALCVQNDLPGIAAIGMRDGQVLVLGSSGRRRVDDEASIGPSDRMHLGSCAKAMTATMIATLVEEGTLSWDLTIADGLPDLARQIDPGFHGVRLLELLQHRGGIAERKNPKLNQLLLTKLARLDGTPREQRLAAISIVLASAPTTEPGKSMEYSNYGYMVAAAIAETATDQSWQDLMRARVFAPLGMTSAGFGLPGTKGIVDEPRGHQREGNDWVALEPGIDPDLPECIAPAGLIHCSLSDWGKFVQAHLEGERGRDGLLKSETFRLLHRVPDDNALAGYACGWGVTQRDWAKGPVYTHSGSNGAWYSVIAASPGSNVAAMAVCNAAGDGPEKATHEAIDQILKLMDVHAPRK